MAKMELEASECHEHLHLEPSGGRLPFASARTQQFQAGMAIRGRLRQAQHGAAYFAASEQEIEQGVWRRGIRGEVNCLVEPPTRRAMVVNRREGHGGDIADAHALLDVHRRAKVGRHSRERVFIVQGRLPRPREMAIGAFQRPRDIH